MKQALILLLMPMVFVSCSKKSGSTNTTTTIIREIRTIYPANTLAPGEGVREVAAIGYACLVNGKATQASECPQIADLDITEEPKEIQKSPPGTGTVVVDNFDAPIQTEFEEGEKWEDLTETEKNQAVLQTGVGCVNGYTLSYDAQCLVPRHVFTYGVAINDLQPCDGVVSRARPYQCVYNISGNTVADTNCDPLELNPLVNISSSAGSRIAVDGNGDTVNYTCGLGKSTLDLGNGTTQEFLFCGSLRHKNVSNICVADTYIAHYSYPVNDMIVGAGTRVVEASAVASCERSHDGVLVSVSSCPMPSTKPSITQSSPAGSTSRTSADGDQLTDTYAVGATTPTTTIASCSPVRSLSEGVCTNDTLTITNPVYPANDMSPGDGTRNVSHTDYTCYNSTKSSNVAKSYCADQVASIPQSSQSSPAGSNPRTTAEGDQVLDSYAVGSTTPTTTVVSCSALRSEVGGVCTNDTLTIVPVYPANDMSPGDGSKEVSHTDYSCYNTTKSVAVAKSNCADQAASIPKETQLSPAGDLFIPITDASGGGVNVPLTEGEDWDSKTPAEKESWIIGDLVCINGTNQIGASCVSPNHIGFNGTYRAYGDGSFATSCDGYKKPTGPKLYSGATGDGVYRISNGGVTTNVECLMSHDANGYTAVAHIRANSRATTIPGAYSDTTSYRIANLKTLAPSLKMDNSSPIYLLDKQVSGVCATIGTSGIKKYTGGYNSVYNSSQLSIVSMNAVSGSLEIFSTGLVSIYESGAGNKPVLTYPQGGTSNIGYDNGSVNFCSSSDSFKVFLWI